MLSSDHDRVGVEVREVLLSSHHQSEGQLLDLRVSSLNVEERLTDVIDWPLNHVFLTYKHGIRVPFGDREVRVQRFVVLWLV